MILGTAITIEEVRDKIGLLAATENGESLKEAMNELKYALKTNPEVANLLYPEDIGELVRHLRKITNTEVSVASEKEVKLSAKKALKQAMTDPDILSKTIDDF